MSSLKSNFEDIFQQALAQYNQGNYAASLPYCQQIITQFPRDFNTLQLGGVSLYKLGQCQEAVAWLEQAKNIDNRRPELLNSLACAYRDNGNITAAIDNYLQALAVSPNYFNALQNLSLVYIQSGKHSEAAPLLTQAISACPNNPDMRLMLADNLISCGEPESAEQIIDEIEPQLRNSKQLDSFRAKIAIQRQDWQTAEQFYRTQLAENPGDAGAWNNLGSIFEKQDQIKDASECYEKAIACEPNLAIAHANLARAYLTLDEIENAVQSGKKALSLAPDLVSTSLTVAEAEKRSGNFEAAEATLISALERNSHFDSGWYNLANMYRDNGRFSEAIQCFENALLIKPDHANAELNLGLALLTTGQFRDGWRHYFQRPRFLNTDVTLSPITPGENFENKRILIIRAQGIGDELIFLRFAKMLKAQGCWLAYQSSTKLYPLLKDLEFIDEVLKEGDELPEVDHVFAIDDLPLLLDIDDTSKIPPAIRLIPDDNYLTEVRSRLKAFGPSPFTAINWRGGAESRSKLSKQFTVLSKSILLENLVDLLNNVKGTIIVAQRFPKPEELEYLNKQFPGRILDLSEYNEDLEKMLALLSEVDSYVGVSNTDMHLLASLGKTADVLIPFPADWRWMAEGNESPWMPGFRVTRQTSRGEWPSLPEGKKGKTHMNNSLYSRPTPELIRSIRIGERDLELHLNSKHEIKAYQDFERGVSDVDVAIAEQIIRPGDTILDLGANIGFVALHYLRLGAIEVHAFEANPFIFERLKKVSGEGLFAYPYAVSDKNETLSLILSLTHRQGSTLSGDVVNIHRHIFGENVQSVDVQSVTIDQFFSDTNKKSFDFIKADIEGAEMAFIKGAQKLFSESPPRVMQIEIMPEFKEEYLKVLNKYFNYARRVDYNRTNGKVFFNTIDGPNLDGFQNLPPNYIFYNDKDLFNTQL